MSPYPSYLDIKFPGFVYYDEPQGDKPKDFFDRETEKLQALDLLLSPDTDVAIWLVGERRAGKTSMLRLFERKCLQQGVVAFYIDGRSVDSSGRFYNEYLDALDKALGLSRSTTRPTSDAEFQQALEDRKEIIANRILVVGLDEIDAAFESLRRDDAIIEQQRLINTLRNLVVRGQKIILTSTKAPESLEIFKASPLAAISKIIHLLPFADHDFEEMMRVYLPSCSQDTLNNISEFSGNWPYYAKAILVSLLQLSPDAPNRWEKAIEEATKLIEPTCQHLYRRHWDDDERRALLLLARRETIRMDDLGVLDARARAAFDSLSQRGYLWKDEDACIYRIRIRLVERWLQQWIYREVREEELNLADWLHKLAFVKETEEREFRVGRDELKRPF